MKRTFTPTQTAKGFLTVFARGDYTLAIQRLRADKQRKKVAEIIARSVLKNELEILKRYAPDLFT